MNQQQNSSLAPGSRFRPQEGQDVLCQAMTRNGQRCKSAPAAGEEYCGNHLRVPASLRQVWKEFIEYTAKQEQKISLGANLDKRNSRAITHSKGVLSIVFWGVVANILAAFFIRTVRLLWSLVKSVFRISAFAILHPISFFAEVVVLIARWIGRLISFLVDAVKAMARWAGSLIEWIIVVLGATVSNSAMAGALCILFVLVVACMHILYWVKVAYGNATAEDTLNVIASLGVGVLFLSVLWFQVRDEVLGSKFLQRLLEKLRPALERLRRTKRRLPRSVRDLPEDRSCGAKRGPFSAE